MIEHHKAVQLPTITVRCTAKRPLPGNKVEVINATEIGDLPEELMAKVDKLTKLTESGDDARISVGSQLSRSEDYGQRAAQSFVSVSLSCSQDKATLKKAFQEAQALSQGLCFQHFESMWQLAQIAETEVV